MDDMGRNDGEEDEEVPDKAVKTKKRSVQKMTTRDLVEATQTSSHQFPGNSMALVIFPSILIISDAVTHGNCPFLLGSV